MQPAGNKRDTGEGLLGAARHSYAHAQYIHNAIAYEFRRGFCTLVLSFIFFLSFIFTFASILVCVNNHQAR